MIFSDMHMHCVFSDGRGEPAEFAAKGEREGLDSIGFSDHSPVPFENSWSMKRDRLDEYVSTISHLKTRKDKVNIYAGIELDYIEGVDVSGYIGFPGLDLDYHIGAVHYIYSRKLDRHLEVDGNAEEFKFLVDEGFSGNARDVYGKYYETVRMMINEYRPPVAAHLDILSKNNKNDMFFDEKEEPYIKEVEKTLDCIAKSKTLVEVNTGGMSRGYIDRPYPSDRILKSCLQKGIGVTLNSDAHDPDGMAHMFEETIERLKLLGFERIFIFKEGGWKPHRL